MQIGLQQNKLKCDKLFLDVNHVHWDLRQNIIILTYEPLNQVSIYVQCMHLELCILPHICCVL